MANKGDRDPGMFGWVSARRAAAGLTMAAVVLVGCGDNDVNLSQDDFFPRDTSKAVVEQESDPELNGQIGDLASATAKNVANILHENDVQPRNVLPDGLYYVLLPEETFMVSLKLEGDPSDLSPENLRLLRITRYHTDEAGRTTDIVEISPSEDSGEWGVGGHFGTVNWYVSPSTPEMEVDGQVYNMDTAQAAIGQMIGRLETAAQEARG